MLRPAALLDRRAGMTSIKTFAAYSASRPRRRRFYADAGTGNVASEEQHATEEDEMSRHLHHLYGSAVRIYNFQPSGEKRP